MAIKNSGAQSIILRCSWIYSLSHKSFLKTITEKAKNNEILTIIEDQIGTPTSATWIAEVSLNILKAIPLKHNFSIFNCVPNGFASWYDLTQKILDILMTDNINIKTNQVIPTSSKEFKQIASRPYNSRLNNNKLKKFLNHNIPRIK